MQWRTTVGFAVIHAEVQIEHLSVRNVAILLDEANLCHHEIYFFSKWPRLAPSSVLCLIAVEFLAPKKHILFRNVSSVYFPFLAFRFSYWPLVFSQPQSVFAVSALLI